MHERVAVIGAGFGGLAAAARLRAKGYEVRLFEAGDQPGGRARVFRRDGFSFDAGPTVITAPYLFDELFECLGKDRRDYFSLEPVDPFYRVMFPDGASFDYVGDEERILSQISRFNAADVDGYRRLVTRIQEIFAIGYEQLSTVPFNRLSEMLRIVPDMIKLKSYKSVYRFVADHIRDERLRQVFTFQPLLVGGSPFSTPSIYLLIHWLERKWGVHFPKGGTATIVSSLVQLLEDVDVELSLNAPIERIETDGGRVSAVRTESGERWACNRVVCNGDPATVYLNLVDPSLRRRNTDRAVRSKSYSMSLFVAYFGASKTYPELAHHSIVLGPRYKGLLKDIFRTKTLADDFSLYLHAPTRSDPGLAPPGHENFYVLSPVPNQRSGIDWQERGDEYFGRILEALEDRLLPGLRDHLVSPSFVDPRYFETEMRSFEGAAFGPEPILRQSAYFRFHNDSEDVRGLHFVGAGVHPGAGLPGVLCSAKVLEHVVPTASHPLPLPTSSSSPRAPAPAHPVVRSPA